MNFDLGTHLQSCDISRNHALLAAPILIMQQFGISIQEGRRDFSDTSKC